MAKWGEELSPSYINVLNTRLCLDTGQQVEMHHLNMQSLLNSRLHFCGYHFANSKLIIAVCGRLSSCINSVLHRNYVSKIKALVA